MFKYITKSNTHSYIFIDLDKFEKVVTKHKFPYDTKITSSKLGYNKDIRKDSTKPKERCISDMECFMWWKSIPQVVINLCLIKISRISMELCGDIQINLHKDIEDSTS